MQVEDCMPATMLKLYKFVNLALLSANPFLKVLFRATLIPILLKYAAALAVFFYPAFYIVWLFLWLTCLLFLLLPVLPPLIQSGKHCIVT